jgi:hypothetical protein
MQTFEHCICIAQARVIEGKRKKAHICTIAFHEPTNSLLRVCLPFNKSKESTIRRWDRFSFIAGKSDPKDTRKESVSFGTMSKIFSKVPEKYRPAIHQQILAKYKDESQLNEQRESIGVLLFDKESISFKTKPLLEKDEKCRLLMQQKGLFFPDFRLYIRGKSAQFKTTFEKQVLQWDFFEAIRKGRDPQEAYKSFLEPYAIIGNTPWNRNSFMVVSILSAPKGCIKHSCPQAFANQLTLNP